MYQTLLTTFVVIIALLFIGRRVYRALRQAVDPAKSVSCGCGCSDCSATCDNEKNKLHDS